MHCKMEYIASKSVSLVKWSELNVVKWNLYMYISDNTYLIFSLVFMWFAFNMFFQ